MTSYPISMVEEFISCWTNYPTPENLTDCGSLDYIDAALMLTNWSYLGHYPSKQKPLNLLNCSTEDMETAQTDVHTLYMCVPGHPTTVDANLCKESQSRDGTDLHDHEDHFPNDNSATSSSMLCVNPASCVYSRLAVPPSTYHFLQVSKKCMYYLKLLSVPAQVKMWKANPALATPGSPFGPLQVLCADFVDSKPATSTDPCASNERDDDKNERDD